MCCDWLHYSQKRMAIEILLGQELVCDEISSRTEPCYRPINRGASNDTDQLIPVAQ